MHITKNYLIPRSKWVNLLKTSPVSTPFQSPDYFDFLNSVPGLSAEAYAVEKNNELLALCVIVLQKEAGIKSYFSRRGIIYGGPLIKENDSNALDTLLKKLNIDMKTKVIYVETRNSDSYSYYKDTFQKNGWTYQPELNFHLDCSTEEIAWKNFNTSRKRQIRKALKNGVIVEPAADITEVGEFYELLKELYANKIKKPLPSAEFFIRLYKTDLAKFLLVKLNGRIIGGITAPLLDKTIFELNICGLDQEFKDAYPSVMATFAAIEYGYKNGFRKFDFMGAGSPDEDYGVREFKSKFGGTQVENGRFIKVFNPALYNLGKLAVNKFNWLTVQKSHSIF